MEEMLGEVEQMERVNLLEPKEVKELIKKRKHFEYKIQKKTKLDQLIETVWILFQNPIVSVSNNIIV